MKKDNITFHLATKEHVEAFYGRPSVVSFKGYAALMKNEVVGIGGVSRVGSARVVFSDMNDKMRPYKKDIVRGIRLIMSLVEETKIPILAYANKEEPTAPKLLSKLGFKETGEVSLYGPVFIKEPKWGH